MKFIQITLLALFLSLTFTQQDFQGCPGEQTVDHFIVGTPKLVSSTEGGKKYSVSTQDSQVISIVSVEGDAKEMGNAIGKLMKTEIQQNVNNFQNFISENVVDLLSQLGIPDYISKFFGNFAVYFLEQMLDLNWTFAEVFVNKRFTQEMKAMAESSGVDYTALRNVNMIQELLQGAGASSMAGVWGESTKNDWFWTFRGLDWKSTNPINNNPLITIYHSTEDNSLPFANIGYAGLVGAVTVINSEGVSIQEKVWVDDGETKVNFTAYVGTPYQFVLRDLAQFGTTLDSLVEQVSEAKKTIKLYVGLGSGQSEEYETMKYSQKYSQFYTSTNSTFTEARPELQDIIFYDQYTQPSNNMCFASILQNSYGELDLENILYELPQYGQTGQSQIVVSSVFSNQIYVAYGYNGQPGYERIPVQISLEDFYGK